MRARTAPGKASQLVSELSALRAEDVAADAMGEAERAALGLAPPRAVLRVLGKPNAGHADGAVLADVQLGLSQPDGRIPAQRAGEPVVYWLAASAKESLPVSLAAFRASFVAKEEPAAEATPSPEARGEPFAPTPPSAE